jgi:hypothetical protein
MSEPSKEAMEKARGIAERQFIEAPTESEQNFVDSIVPEIALEFTNYQKRIEELEREKEDQEKNEMLCGYLLNNLLARIHRDGGQHTATHGITKSVIDAHDVWIERENEIDRLKSHLAKGVKEG